MFLFTTSKKELDITDALKRKEAKITIGGKPVVIKAFKLAQALELFNALGDVRALLDLASTNFPAFRIALLERLPLLLAYCLPGENVKADDVTLAEFGDLLVAIWCVNDLERVISNFTKAVGSMPKLTQGLASSPKF